jgi:hypothetical protein
LLLQSLTSFKVIQARNIFIILVRTINAVIEHVAQQVAERLEIIFTAGGLEIQLAQTCEHKVTSKRAQLLLLNMIFLICLVIGSSESEVNDGQSRSLEATGDFILPRLFTGRRQLVLVSHKNIIEFQVVVNVASVVDLFK